MLRYWLRAVADCTRTCRATPALSISCPQQEIDRLLSGGGALQAASDPWGTFGASASASYNAFAESGEAAVATGTGFVLASPSQQEASTPTFGGGIGAGGSGDWGGAARAASPEAGAGNDWFGNSGAAEQAARGGKAIGTGTVLHTFVGDYNQPEELSVFEGDKVRQRRGHVAPRCTTLLLGRARQRRIKQRRACPHQFVHAVPYLSSTIAFPTG